MSEDKLSDDVEKLFIGMHEVTLDEKNRCGISAAYSRIIKARNPDAERSIWMVQDTRNGSPYIACLDKRGWEKNHIFILGADVEQNEVDHQGRIVISKRLLKHIGLENGNRYDAIVASSPRQSHFEIWKRENFDKSYKIAIEIPKIWEL